MTAPSSHHRPRYRLVPVLAAACLAAAGLALAPSAAQATTSVPAGVGVLSGVTRTALTGDQTITTDNSVYQDKAITGKLIINAVNVTVLNVSVTSASQTGDGIHVNNGKSATFNNVTVSGFENSVSGGNYSFYRGDVSGMGADGFKVGTNVDLVGNYCHGMNPLQDAHPDCAQIQSGVEDVTITGNYFDATGGGTALFIAPDLGPSTYGPVDVVNNYFNGGNFSVQSVDGASGTYHIYRIMFEGNRFGNTHTYGYESISEYIDYHDNVRDDTGAGV